MVGALTVFRPAIGGRGQPGTSTFDPCSYPRVSYSVVATFYWRGATTGQETWRPNNGWALLCA